MCEALVLVGIAVSALSGCLGLLGSRNSVSGQWMAAVIAIVGNALGLWGTFDFWISGTSVPLDLPWRVARGQISVGVDGLSANILLPVVVISLLGNLYGRGYWSQTEHSSDGR